MTPLYHITHIRNLAAIVAADGLWCDRLRLLNAPGAVSIAHQHIKDRRAARRVPIGADGTLADYVPVLFRIALADALHHQPRKRPRLH